MVEEGSELKLVVTIDVYNTMQRILKKLLRQKVDPQTNYRGTDPTPVKPWRRNVFAALIGTVGGLYIGQYFPDLYYERVYEYLPNFKELQEMAPATQGLKPKPDYPKSIRDIPENILIRMGRRKEVQEGSYGVRNDVTKEVQEYKVTRVFNAGKRESQSQLQAQARTQAQE